MNWENVKRRMKKKKEGIEKKNETKNFFSNYW